MEIWKLGKDTMKLESRHGNNGGRKDEVVIKVIQFK